MYVIQGLIFAGCISYKVRFLLDVYYTRFDFCWMYIVQGLIFAGCILYKV